MENKILIKLNLPELDICFDIFIPVNEVVWKIKKLLIKSISDLMDVSLNLNDEYLLINRDTGNVYNNNDIVINTDIRNSTELFLISSEH